jgi:cell division inhibitor SepF
MGAMARLLQFLGFEEEPEEEEELAEEPGRRKAPVLSLHTHRQLEIVVLEPKNLEEARDAADCLKHRRPVIVNLREAERDVARRIVDFLCGVDYALDGHVQQVGEEIFLFAPSHVAITAPSAATARTGSPLLPLS